MKEHRYSAFALDLHWTEPSRDPDLGAHVATCDQCRAYLENLGALDARALVLPDRRTTGWRRGLVAAFALAIVFAAGIVVWLRSSREPSTPASTYVATKSAPAVQVLLRRDGKLRSWNGEDHIRDHDALALRVACEAMARVTVLVRERDTWKQTYEGSCTDDVLPFTLLVDDQPGDERIAVVLSRSSLQAADVWRAADARTESADVWAMQFAFTKERPK